MTAPRLNLNHVASFLALVKTGSFGSAAKSLGLSQAAISQHLSRLEACLAVPLINRARSGCTPTESAKRFLPIARSLIAIEARAAEAVSGETLRLGACSNIGIYLLPDLTRDFGAAGAPLPALTIASNPSIAAALDDAEIDVALMEWWDDRPGFRAERWREEPVLAIAAPDHPWATQAHVSRAKLAAEPLIGGEPGTGTGRILRHYLGETRTLPRPLIELGSTEAVKRAVMAGLGNSIVLALAVTEEVRAGRLVARPLKPGLRKPLYLVWREGVPLNHPLIVHLRRAAAIQ
jgi:DNA-binding transcriptional LysR family regulator